MPGYYDIDDILAEEELVPCKTFFDFSYLSHLDPDTAVNSKQHYLPENSKIKMPVWALRKWADLGFCRVTLPKHYGLRARELLQADPAAVTLRPRFFRSGQCVTDLIEISAHRNAKNLAAQPSSARRTAQLQQLEDVLQEARKLRETLLQTYTGARLCHTLDWALSSVGDDVTAYISKLTDMEKRLYRQAAISAANHYTWKMYGNHRCMPHAATTAAASSSTTTTTRSNSTRTVSPTTAEDEQRHRDKRARNN